MTVICINNTGRSLPPRYFDDGYTKDSVFHVTVGNQYTVFGIELWRSVIVVLVLDDTELPCWYPIDLFTISDPHLPADWFFASYPGNDLLVRAVWGYEHLVMDTLHHDALADRDPKAMKIFRQEVLKTRGSES